MVKVSTLFERCQNLDARKWRLAVHHCGNEYAIENTAK